MADGNEKPVKGEDGAEDTDLKARCKLAAEEDDDDDNVPLAISRGNNKKKSGNQPKVKKEDLDGEEDEKTPKGKTQKKEGTSLSKVKKEHTLSVKGKEMKKDGKASKVKREEIEVWDQEEGSNKGKTPKKGSTKSKLKKEGLYSDDEEEKTDKDKKKKKKKGEIKKVVGKGSMVVATQVKDKKERKVYDLPGQKHDPPVERDPLRIFYETLHEQVPNSEMASTWMMEWGLLPLEEAKMVYQKKVKKSQQQKFGSPVKAVTVKKTSTISVKKVTKTSSQTVSNSPKLEKKKKASESETDDDNFILSKRTPKSGKKRKANESESDGDDDDFVMSKAKKRKV